ncbi:MAG: TVP38/TMEM64 family protein [Clostridia bacterium]|nr:TVP38/TMEM64 family protein [Clostridia bacterium]
MNINDKGSRVLFAARAAVMLFIAIAAVWYFGSGQKFSVEAILSYTPESYLAATLFMIALYAMKSIVFFLPLAALQIAVGLFFPTWAAILVNILCMMVEIAIPYWLGRKLGFNSADKLFRKFPKVRSIVDGDGSKWFVSYILRAVNFLPFDLVSMYLGSAHFPFATYFTGSLTGALFGILAATLIGTSLTDPTSPLFILSILLSCTLAGLSCLIYWRITRKKQP